jgi:hypothetical protein
MKVGNLLAMMQMGEMPHDLVAKSIRLFSERCSRTSRACGTRGFEHHWWPTGVPQTASVEA